MEVKATVDEAVGVAQEIYGFWGKLASMFGSAPKPAQIKPVAKKKEKFVAVDETEVMVGVVKQLTEFFKIQEQLAAHIREEEEKSRNVFNPDQNQMEAALKRVMAMDQMAALEVTIEKPWCTRVLQKWARCTAKCLKCEMSLLPSKKRLD